MAPMVPLPTSCTKRTSVCASASLRNLGSKRRQERQKVKVTSRRMRSPKPSGASLRRRSSSQAAALVSVTMRAPLTLRNHQDMNFSKGTPSPSATPISPCSSPKSRWRPRSAKPSRNSCGCTKPSHPTSSCSNMYRSSASESDCKESAWLKTCFSESSICTDFSSTRAHSAAPRATAPSRWSTRDTAQPFAFATSRVRTSRGNSVLESFHESPAVRPVGITKTRSRLETEETISAKWPSTVAVQFSQEELSGGGGRNFGGLDPSASSGAISQTPPPPVSPGCGNSASQTCGGQESFTSDDP
mmetsp:Transcript_32231/g.68576  ORF Transcript_32231/g.68576 Transcript_32231/m.68576 type:complete len:301 (+) Transcript_32231:228-1130(+)